MSLLYLTGPLMNAWARTGWDGDTASTPDISPAAASSGPATQAYDGDPSCPVIWGSVATDSYINREINALRNGNFEAGSAGAAPSNWSTGNTGTGTSYITTTGGEVYAGTKSLKMTAGTGIAFVYQTVLAAPGEYRQINAWAKDSASGTVRFHVQNLKTGKYWNGSTWAASLSGAAITLTGSYAQASTTYQVEDFDTCMASEVSLVVGVLCSAGVCLVDSIFDSPGIDFVGVFGHNLGGVIVPTVKSVDYAGTTTRATMTLRRGAFYANFTRAYALRWDLVLAGTPHTAPVIGEIVVGQYRTADVSPDWGFETSRQLPGVRQTSPARRVGAYTFSPDPTEDLDMTFSGRTAAEASDFSNSLWLRSSQGQYPTVIVPIDSETPAYFGRLLEPNTVERPFQGVYNTRLRLQGDPMPVPGA